jgi:hypothetical protein
MNPRALQQMFLVAAAVLCVIALWGAIDTNWRIESHGIIGCGLAIMGFAIASGLALIAAAIVSLRDRSVP